MSNAGAWSAATPLALPEGWCQRRLSDLLSLEYGASLPDSQRSGEGYPVFGSSGQVGRHRQHLVDGPGVIVGRKGTVGAVTWSNEPFWPIDTTYYVRPESDLDFRWLYWLLLTLPLKSLDSSTGVPGLNRNDAYRIEVPIPPYLEQRRVAEILDTLDAAIARTEALIAKLKQVKAGLLHDLLTRGLDEHGRLRETEETTDQFRRGPDGHTTFPPCWNVRLLGEIATIGSGVTLGRELTGPSSVELPYLRVANVQDGYLDLSEVKTIRVLRTEVDRYLLQSGDVLMNEGGDFDKLGRGTVWRGQIAPCLHQNHVFRVRPNSDVLRSDYLAAVSGSAYGKRFFVLGSKQTTNLASINSTQLKSFPVPLPSVEEQDRILTVVAAETAQVEQEAAFLAKLTQLKRGLMDDLLTGRVGVASLNDGFLPQPEGVSAS